ncbi:MAG: hypothetical protein M1602_06875 [Firmicutes bacterium]|nr:hypothetical protein [Bacillota bacterium]
MPPDPHQAQPSSAEAAWRWTALGLAYLALVLYAVAGGHLRALPGELAQAARMAGQVLAILRP